MPTEEILIGQYLESKYEMAPEEYVAHKNFVIRKLEKLAKQYEGKEFKRETVLAVAFSPEPQGRHRVIDPIKDYQVIIDYKTGYSLADDKKKFPSIFDNEFVFGIKTNKRTLIGRIYRRYKWNNADIVGIIQIIALCSKDDRRVILGSGLHDFLLEYRQYLYNNFIKEYPDLSIDEFRWVTSDTFRWVINSQGMSSLQAKIMSNVMDCFQKYWERKRWAINIYEDINK